MEEAYPLDRLKTGQRAVIASVDATEQQKRRLMELGFVPGGRIEALLEGPWGDPVAYAVCGAVIALRRADAHQITIRQPV